MTVVKKPLSAEKAHVNRHERACVTEAEER